MDDLFDDLTPEEAVALMWLLSDDDDAQEGAGC